MRGMVCAGRQRTPARSRIPVWSSNAVIKRWAMSGSEQADDPAAHDAIGLEEFDHPVKDQTHAHGGDEKSDNARSRVDPLRPDFFRIPLE